MSYHRWTEQDVKKLIDIYSNERNDNISKILNIDIDKIERKAGELKLKKSKEQISKNISKRNKLTGRDLSYENLKVIASKYKTRGEFQRLDASAYTTSRISGYLDDICSHMTVGSFSVPQLTLYYIIKEIFIDDSIEYNCKSVIKPYELDIYIDKYRIGFEYDGKLWHIDNKLDMIKDELCKSNNIELIRLKENNRKYSEDIKTQLIENIETINNICNRNIKTDDILNIKEYDINEFINCEIIDEDKIIDIISKYSNFHDFKKNEFSLYVKLIRRKTLKKYTSHLIRNSISWTEELAKNEVKKYSNLLEFIKKSNSCYGYIKRNKLEVLLKPLYKKYLTYNILDLEEEIKKYKYLKDFRQKCMPSYEYIIRNKLGYLIKELYRYKPKEPFYSILELENEISKYENVSDFRTNSSKYYFYIKRHKMLYLVEKLKIKKEKD